MKKSKIVRGSKKVAKSSTKLVSKKESLSKSFNGKSPVFISLGLNEFIEGLEVNLIVERNDKEHLSFVTLSLYGEPIACADMEWEQKINPEDGGLDVFAEITR